MAGVGIVANCGFGVARIFVPWYAPKKNSLFRTMGPPSVPPYWLRFSVSVSEAKAFRALRAPLRKNSKMLPWNSLVPDFVTAFTVPAECWPYCADKPLVSSLNS
jgi:hypothetical protein